MTEHTETTENKAITLEECIEYLTKALKEGNTQEIEKWDYLIRAENEWRVRCKQKDREFKEMLRQSRLKEMYRI